MLKEKVSFTYNNDNRFVNGYDLYKEMLSDEENRKQIVQRNLNSFMKRW